MDDDPVHPSNHMQRPTTGFYATAPAPTEFDPVAERALVAEFVRRGRRQRIWMLVVILALAAIPATITLHWRGLLLLGLAIVFGAYNVAGPRLFAARRGVPPPS